MILNIVTENYGEKESKISVIMFKALSALPLPHLVLLDLKVKVKGFTRLEINMLIILWRPRGTFKNQLWLIFFCTKEVDTLYRLDFILLLNDS